MPTSIPPTIRGQKYISLTTVRKNGQKVATPVWFGEDGDKLYVMTISKMGKVKRIRNNPLVEVAPCTMRGKLTGAHGFCRRRSMPMLGRWSTGNTCWPGCHRLSARRMRSWKSASRSAAKPSVIERPSSNHLRRFFHLLTSFVRPGFGFELSR
jgi:hypothetical protein